MICVVIIAQRWIPCQQFVRGIIVTCGRQPSLDGVCGQVEWQQADTAPRLSYLATCERYWLMMRGCFPFEPRMWTEKMEVCGSEVKG